MATPNPSPDRLARLDRLEGYLREDASNPLLLAEAFDAALAAGALDRAGFHLQHGLALVAQGLHDIDPVAWGIMMIVNVEIGFLTFPFGLNLFVAMGIAKRPLTYVARAVGPFLILLFLCLLMVTYIPSLSTWLPNLLK